jgi:hypothetical protein
MDGEGWTPELKADKTLSKYKSPADLATAHVNLQKMLGSRVEIPNEKTDPEAAKVFWGKLGVPDNPEGYEAFAAPEGRKADEAMIGGFRKVAHGAKLSKGQVTALEKWYVEQELARETALSQEYAEEQRKGMEVLKAEWGAAADINLGYTHRLVAEHGGADLQAALAETGAGNDPRVVKFFSKIGKMLADDGLMKVENLSARPNEAQEKIAAVMNDKNHPYWNERAPGHKEAVLQMQGWYEVVHNRV